MNPNPQPKESAEYRYDQKNPAYRKALKRLIESGTPRSLAREVAREQSRKVSN